MLQQVDGDNTMLHSYVSEWHKKFKEGCEEVNLGWGGGGFQQAGLRSHQVGIAGDVWQSS